MNKNNPNYEQIDIWSWLLSKNKEIIMTIEEKERVSNGWKYKQLKLDIRR
jgi:hypothetical protein